MKAFDAITPVLEGSSRLRLATVFVLYVGQGLPIGLFAFAIPAWMAVNGASAKDIAFLVTMFTIPWSFKFIAGFLIDRYTLLSMGRRRCWIIGAQAMIIATLCLSAIIGPGPGDVLLLGMLGLAVSTATVFQDVAIDALIVDLLPEQERAMAGALSSGGQVIGVAASASFAGAMVHAFGPSAAYLACAALIGLITAYAIWVRERVGERRLPWSRGTAHASNLAVQPHGWLPMLVQTLRTSFSPVSLAWLPVIMTVGLMQGVCLVALPLIATGHAGWTEAQIGSLNGTAQLTAGIATIVIGGIAVAKIGAQRSMQVGYAASIVLIGWMVVSEASWGDPRTVTIFGFGWVLLWSMLKIGMVVIVLRMCPPAIGATQFSVYAAFSNMGITLAGVLIGTFAALAEPKAMLLLLIAAQVVALAIFYVMRFPTRGVSDDTASPVPDAQTVAT